jgi:uroporphyrinogen decarboxylase
MNMARQIGVDVVLVTGDLAGERTTLISPEHYRQYIKPYHKEIVDCAHQKGLRIVTHTDGNAWPILDDLVEVGFDGFHPVQPQCMDIAAVKEHVAGRMCIIGNIDCRNLLPFGTGRDVEKAVRETIERAASGGGYIISSSNSVHAGCKAENYIAMIQAAHKYGAYD